MYVLIVEPLSASSSLCVHQTVVCPDTLHFEVVLLMTSKPFRSRKMFWNGPAFDCMVVLLVCMCTAKL